MNLLTLKVRNIEKYFSIVYRKDDGLTLNLVGNNIQFIVQNNLIFSNMFVEGRDFDPRYMDFTKKQLEVAFELL
jgi:hypothetical protein